MIGVAMFDRRSNRFGKWYGRIEVEAIQRPAAARAFFTFYRGAVQSKRERAAAEVESSKKIVFRSGADDRGMLLSVNEEHVVAFAPPIVLILKDGHRDAHEESAAGGLHPDIIGLTVHVFLLDDSRVEVRSPLIGRAGVQ